MQKIALIICLLLASCASFKPYQYVPKNQGEAPAFISKSADVMEPNIFGGQDISSFGVVITNINGRGGYASNEYFDTETIAFSPGLTSVTCHVGGVSAASLIESFTFQAKANEHYKFQLLGEKSRFNVFLKDSQGNVVYRKSFAVR